MKEKKRKHIIVKSMGYLSSAQNPKRSTAAARTFRLNFFSRVSVLSAQTFGLRALGSMAWVIPLSITVSTFGSANGTLFAAGRLCFAASREGHLLNVLSYIHIKKLTPMPSIIFHVSDATSGVLYFLFSFVCPVLLSMFLYG